MNTLIAVKPLPKILSFSEVKYYIFSFVFTILSVYTPFILHRFQLAGPQFLPMHFFILIAGFLFGWRTGLLVGVLSPLISYGISHLPPMAILPETVLELAVYGFVIGIARERKIGILPALFLAMALGRISRLLFVLVFSLNTNPLKFFQMSWPGIALQIILIPLIIFLLQKFLFSGKNENSL